MWGSSKNHPTSLQVPPGALRTCASTQSSTLTPPMVSPHVAGPLQEPVAGIHPGCRLQHCAYRTFIGTVAHTHPLNPSMDLQVQLHCTGRQPQLDAASGMRVYIRVSACMARSIHTIGCGYCSDPFPVTALPPTHTAVTSYSLMQRLGPLIRLAGVRPEGLEDVTGVTWVLITAKDAEAAAACSFMLRDEASTLTSHT